MIHHLKYGKHRIAFEESEHVIAVREPEGRKSLPAPGLLSLELAEDRDPASLNPGSVDTLAQAGWTLRAPATESLRRGATHAERVGEADARRTLVAPNGTVLLDSGFVTLKLPSDVSREQAVGYIQEAGLVVHRRLPFGENLYEARLTPGRPTLETLAELQEREERFVFVEPQFLEHIGPRHQPPAPDYGRQWHWHNAQKTGADVHAEAAWDITRGLRLDGQGPVRIALVDLGFDLAHPQLAPALFRGGHFTTEGAGRWRFVPRPQEAFPDSPHGTFCPGMALARPGATGGCGLAHEAAFIPVACLNDQVGTQATLASALAYAALPQRSDPTANARDGADVVSCSLGPNTSDFTLTRVLELAITDVVTRGRDGRGAVLVWAVSNGPYDLATDEVCSHPSVVSVGRTTREDRYGGGAYGEALDVVAPGVGVYSTRSGGTWGVDTGTSFATPVVAGVAALLLAQRPDLSREAAVQRILDTCQKVGGVAYGATGKHPQYGHGRVDAGAALGG